MTKVEYIEIHEHSCFSRRDAHSRVDLLVKRAKENGQRAVALTDHGVLHGIPQLFREAQKHDIKAIAGFEGYMTKGARGEASPHFHQLLIAKNAKGFKNLSKLSSEAFLSGFYNKPRFDFELLEKHSEGLIATSSCLAGMIPQAILNGDIQEARSIAQKFVGIFGEDFYIEIQHTPTESQKMVNLELIKIAELYSIELVATGDVHYVDKDDKDAHLGMLCLGRAQKMHEVTGYDGEENYYLKSAQEVAKTFLAQGYDKELVIRAMNNTGKIADKVDFELIKEKDHLPLFPLPEGATDKDKYIGELVKDGLMRKVAIKSKTYIDRIKYELSVIREKGYQDYFLIVADAMKFAKREGIILNFGRGSGAGSLVAFLLDITEVDPIIHGLYFERFLDVTRTKMPDIDSDIEDERRYEVLDYLKEKYGWENVSQVINYGTMTATLAMRNALMVYDIPMGKSMEISNLIDSGTLEEAFKVSPQLRAIRKQSVKDNRGKTVELAQVFSLAEKFEGVVDKLSTHAGGILITPTPISDNFPVYGTRERMVTQWDKDDLEKLGGVKFDFLGLKTLRVVGLAVESIYKEHGIKLDVYKIGREANDPKVYERIAKGNTHNTFQFNSSGMQDLCKAVKPTEFKHIVAINALYRPPALASGDTWRYARIKNGQEAEYYSHPWEEEITGETFGVITYQEHVMEIVHKFAGWDYSTGDKLRKMNAEQLEYMRPDWLNDCECTFEGLDKEQERQMNEIWDRIIQYMGYGFNKSHGVAYSMLSYLTAWLEEHYPEHYQSALMTVKMGDADKIAQLFQDVKKAGFEFQTPDINLSGETFTAFKGKIVFPLGVIKGAGDGAVKELIEKRPFSSLEEILEKCNSRVVSLRAIKPMIFSGVFDSLYPDLNRAEIYARYIQLKGDKKKAEEAYDLVQKWSDDVQGDFEKTLLGVYITKHPLSKYHFRDWREYQTGQQGCLVGGMVSKIKKFNDKNGQAMAFVTVDTLEGAREIVVFASSMKKADKLLAKGNMIMAEGKKDGEKLILSKLKELS